MAIVFISYSRKDIEFAKQLTEELQKDNLDFWVDWEGIPPTVDWWRQIEKGIEEADSFLFLISPDSAKSKVCGQEIDCAVKNGKRLIPLVVRDIKGDEVPSQLSHLNWIFFRESDDFDAAVKKLLEAIHTDYEWVQAHRRLQVKALEWERNNHENSLLLRGKDLQDAELKLAINTSKEPHPTDLQREYVSNSRKSADRQRRIITSISIAGVIALAALAVFGFYQAGQARTSEATAVVNEQEAKRQAATAQAASTLAFNNAGTALANLVIAQTAQADAINKAIISQGLQLGSQSQNLLLSRKPIDAFRLKYVAESTLHNVENSQLSLDLLNAQGSYSSLAVSSDGRYLATVLDKQIVMWDTRNLAAEPIVLQGHKDIVYTLTFSPDSKILASGSADNTIILWNMSTHSPLIPTLVGHSSSVVSIVFSPDSRTLASGSVDNTIILWNVKTGQPIGQPGLDIGAITNMAMSPDGLFLAIGSGNSTVAVWSNLTRQQETFFKMEKSINGLSFSPDQRKLVVITDHEIAVYNLTDLVSNNPKALNLYKSTQYVFSQIVYNPDGSQFAIGTSDGVILIWNINELDKPTLIINTIDEFAKIEWLR